MNNPNYLLHDKLYQKARQKGWDGWGGNERIAHGHIWLERLFDYADLPKRGRVLELGCGEGNYSRRLAALGYSVVGVDVSPTAIQWAREKAAQDRHAIEYRVADCTKAGILPKNEFDLVVDGNCLHCIIGEDRPIFLQNVYAALKTDSLFFISSLCSTAGKGENKTTHFEESPYRFIPSQAHLHHELEAVGFEVKQSAYHSGMSKNHGHCTLHAKKKSRAG